MTDQIKLQIIEAVKVDRKKFKSQADHARKFGIKDAQYSRFFIKGELNNVIADDVLISIAMDLQLSLKNNSNLVIANTPTFVHITTQLQRCQNSAMSLMFCDKCDIGKTVAAVEYMKNNAGVVYVDCSQVKTARRLIKEIARLFGIDTKGSYEEVVKKLKFYLNNIINDPLIILDEFGDLKQEAYLEIKGLWNGTKGNCGWYAMGADGLKAKFERMMENKKVGFAELYSRFNGKDQNITESDQWIGREKEFTELQLAIIAKANGYTNIQQLIADSDGSLRRLSHVVAKYA